MRLAKILSGGQTLRGGQTLALVQGLAIHRGAPYEIRYADHPSTHSVMDFAGVYVLYLVLTVAARQPSASGSPTLSKKGYWHRKTIRQLIRMFHPRRPLELR